MYPPVEELLSQAKSLVDKFKQQKEAQYIDDAINLDREALKLCPPDHTDRSVVLMHLTQHLYGRYKQLGSIGDLDEAIVLCREVVALCPLGHSQRSFPLNNLALFLSDRYKELGSMGDLDEAIVLCREALTLRPPGHSQRSSSLNNLAIFLSDRYKVPGSMGDLGEVIVLCREALALCPPGHTLRSSSLNNLALSLSDRYKQAGSMGDLDEAIVLCREALALFPSGHSQRSSSLNNLAISLSDRYKKLGSMGDLDEAIVLCRESLALFPSGHSQRSVPLNNLAAHLSNRYNRLGSMGDLDEAIILCRESLALRPPGHFQRSESLNNLAAYLSDRYEQLGSIGDLDEAIVLCREALALRPPEHTLRSSSLNNLAIFLSDRYKQLGSMGDLDEAIVLCRESLALRPPGHSQRSESLNSLAIFLSYRYKQLGSMGDIDEAIVLCREALALRPLGHALRSSSLNNLAAYLSDRHEQLGSMGDLDEAVVLCRESLALRPPGHSQRSSSLNNLAIHLYQRFASSRQLADKEEMFSLYSQLVYIGHLVSPSHLSAARQWIYMAEDFQHPTLLLAYQSSLQLLVHHLATLPSLPQHHNILKKHTSSLAVDAFSACLRNRAPTQAVELLEQGRGVFWSQLTRLHSPLHDVRASGPEGEKLADEFTHLSFLIHGALNSPGVDQHERVFRLNVRMETVVANIRELPGLSRFLLPSLFSDLQCTASAGPVIIVSASKYGCDALIVLHDRDPIHILLHLTQEDVRYLSTNLHKAIERAKVVVDAKRELVMILRQLWDQVVSPIVDVLQATVPLQSRIWWCPAGEFSGLPLHAAGPFRSGRKNLPSLFISSYTPTLTALIRARRSEPIDHTTDSKRFIAIGQGNAPGENELPSVAAELDLISQGIDGIAAFTRIDGNVACISRVVEELGESEWVHFACHGLPNPKLPFESAFALHDGYFTIQRIIGCELKNPEFAYLSACRTTVGDKESPDEVIHLASAMQFIGFRSVIGTMWSVADRETKKITPTFYKHVVNESGRLDYTRAAYALNKTMRSVNVPFDQRILYIHLGA